MSDYLLIAHTVGVYYNEGPPVPIPNTVVKLISAEDTWWETARENRSMPTLKASCIIARSLFILSCCLLIFFKSLLYGIVDRSVKSVILHRYLKRCI